MSFNYGSAKKSGYSDEEIQAYLEKSHPNFKISEALKSGYSLEEISSKLNPDNSLAAKSSSAITPKSTANFVQDTYFKPPILPPFALSGLEKAGKTVHSAVEGVAGRMAEGGEPEMASDVSLLGSIGELTPSNLSQLIGGALFPEMLLGKGLEGLAPVGEAASKDLGAVGSGIAKGLSKIPLPGFNRGLLSEAPFQREVGIARKSGFNLPVASRAGSEATRRAIGREANIVGGKPLQLDYEQAAKGLKNMADKTVTDIAGVKGDAANMHAQSPATFFKQASKIHGDLYDQLPNDTNAELGPIRETVSNVIEQLYPGFEATPGEYDVYFGKSGMKLSKTQIEGFRKALGPGAKELTPYQVGEAFTGQGATRGVAAELNDLFERLNFEGVKTGDLKREAAVLNKKIPWETPSRKWTVQDYVRRQVHDALRESTHQSFQNAGLGKVSDAARSQYRNFKNAQDLSAVVGDSWNSEKKMISPGKLLSGLENMTRDEIIQKFGNHATKVLDLKDTAAAVSRSERTGGATLNPFQGIDMEPPKDLSTFTEALTTPARNIKNRLITTPGIQDWLFRGFSE